MTLNDYWHPIEIEQYEGSYRCNETGCSAIASWNVVLFDHHHGRKGLTRACEQHVEQYQKPIKTEIE